MKWRGVESKNPKIVSSSHIASYSASPRLSSKSIFYQFLPIFTNFYLFLPRVGTNLAQEYYYYLLPFVQINKRSKVYFGWVLINKVLSNCSDLVSIELNDMILKICDIKKDNDGRIKVS